MKFAKYLIFIILIFLMSATGCGGGSGVGAIGGSGGSAGEDGAGVAPTTPAQIPTSILMSVRTYENNFIIPTDSFISLEADEDMSECTYIFTDSEGSIVTDGSCGTITVDVLEGTYATPGTWPDISAECNLSVQCGDDGDIVPITLVNDVDASDSVTGAIQENVVADVDASDSVTGFVVATQETLENRFSVDYEYDIIPGGLRPTLSRMENKLHTVYLDTIDGTQGIYYSTSTDDGDTFSSGTLLMASTGILNPMDGMIKTKKTSSGTKVVGVMFTGPQTINNGAAYSYSINDGVTFTSAYTVKSDLGQLNAVCLNELDFDIDNNAVSHGVFINDARTKITLATLGASSASTQDFFSYNSIGGLAPKITIDDNTGIHVAYIAQSEGVISLYVTSFTYNSPGNYTEGNTYRLTTDNSLSFTDITQIEISTDRNGNPMVAVLYGDTDDCYLYIVNIDESSVSSYQYNEIDEDVSSITRPHANLLNNIGVFYISTTDVVYKISGTSDVISFGNPHYFLATEAAEAGSRMSSYVSDYGQVYILYSLMTGDITRLKMGLDN